MLNLKHLYYFYIFVQAKSTTEAAKRLRITSPALSIQLKQLEEYMGVPLTRRKGGKLMITEHGEIVLHYAQRMFSAYEELKTKLSSNPDLKSTRFRVGICQNIGAQFSFDLLSLIEGNNFSRAKKVEIIFDENERILADFMDDQFDVVFATVQKSSTERKEWVSQDLSYPVRLFGPSSLTEGFEARGGQAQSTGVSCLIELANSKNISLVLPTSSSLRDETDTFLSGSTVKPLRTIECNRSGGIVQLIERGFAMGFVPTPCLLDFKSAQALAVLGPPGGYWSHRLSILVHKDHKDVKKSVDKKHKLTDLFLSAEFN